MVRSLSVTVICILILTNHTTLSFLEEVTSKGIASFMKKIGQAFSDLFQCSYSCSNGGYPIPRAGYIPTPNGCGTDSTMFTKELAKFLPSVNECCSAHDVCYGSCGKSKASCDNKFRKCLNDVCSVAKEVAKAVGSKFDVKDMCEVAGNSLFTIVASTGCTAYKAAQNEACFCTATNPEL